jgi:hypothetical protein
MAIFILKFVGPPQPLLKQEGKLGHSQVPVIAPFKSNFLDSGRIDQGDYQIIL